MFNVYFYLQQTMNAKQNKRKKQTNKASRENEKLNINVNSSFTKFFVFLVVFSIELLWMMEPKKRTFSRCHFFSFNDKPLKLCMKVTMGLLFFEHQSKVWLGDKILQ